jgi:hypothetical protein
MTMLMWVRCCVSPLLCIDLSRSLEPMNRSINPTSCYTPEWTIGAKGLSAYMLHADTGVPSWHRAICCRREQYTRIY